MKNVTIKPIFFSRDDRQVSQVQNSPPAAGAQFCDSMPGIFFHDHIYLTENTIFFQTPNFKRSGTLYAL
jgi:hypothetical protein